MAKLADGLADGHRAYGEGVVSRQTAVLFLVQEAERNVFDQRWLEYSLLEKKAPQNSPLPSHPHILFRQIKKKKAILIQ